MKTKNFFRVTAGLAMAIVFAFVPFSRALAVPPVIERFSSSGDDYHLIDCGDYFINGHFDVDLRISTFFNGAGIPIRAQIKVDFVGMLTNENNGETMVDPQHATAFLDLVEGTETDILRHTLRDNFLPMIRETS